MMKRPLRDRIYYIAQWVGRGVTLPLLFCGHAHSTEATEVPFEPHLSISALHEKARLNHLHNALMENSDYASLIKHLQRVGLKQTSPLTAMFFESSVDDEALSYGITSCEYPIPHCVDVDGTFSLNHYRVSFYSDRLLRETELIGKVVQAINYQESMTNALRKGPILKPDDIDEAATQLISTRAHFYQLMHENGSMGVSGIVAAPESLSLALFNAKRVSRMSSYFSDAFASLETYLTTEIGDTKVLEVGEKDVDVSISVSTSMTDDGKTRLRNAFLDAFEEGQPVNLMGEGEALYFPSTSSIAVFNDAKGSVKLCLATLPDVSAKLPADHVKLFNLIKRSEMRMDYSIGNAVVDVSFISSSEHSVKVRIPYEDETRTRRIRTVDIDCDMSLSIATQVDTLARVNVRKAELSSIKWKGDLYSNL